MQVKNKILSIVSSFLVLITVTASLECGFNYYFGGYFVAQSAFSDLSYRIHGTQDEIPANQLYLLSYLIEKKYNVKNGTKIILVPELPTGTQSDLPFVVITCTDDIITIYLKKKEQKIGQKLVFQKNAFETFMKNRYSQLHSPKYFISNDPTEWFFGIEFDTSTGEFITTKFMQDNARSSILTEKSYNYRTRAFDLEGNQSLGLNWILQYPMGSQSTNPGLWKYLFKDAAEKIEKAYPPNVDILFEKNIVSVRFISDDDESDVKNILTEAGITVQ